MIDGNAATLAEILAAVRENTGELRALRAEVRALRPRDVDRRLCAFLEAVYGFSRAEPWNGPELVAETQRARDHEVLAVVEEITRHATDRCKSLGRWLARHAGASAGGLTLHQIGRNREGAWIYSVSRCGE